MSAIDIVVEAKSSILGDSMFWRGSPARIGDIKNLPARETAFMVAKDGKARRNGMWHVRAEPAQAPDAHLLAAAREALAALENCYQITDWPADGQTQQDAAIASLNAAIAKAEGKPS